MPSFGLETPTLFRAKPSVYISGSRLTLAYRHLAPSLRQASYSSASWVTANIYYPEGDDVQTRAPRSLLSTPVSQALPSIENLSGSTKANLSRPFKNLAGLSLDHLRGPVKPSTQHLLWTGPDAITGAGSMAIGSTEDHGWVSPVTARESSLRSALAVKASTILYLQSNLNPLNPSVPTTALLLPFDLNARCLISHNSRLSGALPFTWTAASAALESEIETASTNL